MDLKTIFICLFVINLFLGIFTFAIKKTQTTFPGINFWIVSNLFIAFGYLLFSQRNLIPDYVSIVIAQCLFLLAGITRIYGLKNFFNQKISLWLNIISATSIIVFLLLISSYTYLQNNLFARTIISCIFLSGIAIITGLQILKNKSGKNLFSYIFTATVFFLFSLIFISRVLGWVLFPEVRDLFKSAFINNMQFLSSLVIDITWTTMFFVLQNQRLTNELARSAEKYLSIYSNTFSGILLINKEGKYLDINPTFSKITGYSLSEMIEKSMGIITYPDDLDKIRTALTQMGSQVITCFDDQIRIIHKNGNIIWVQLNANINYNLNGEFEYILVEIFDITVQKNAEQEIINAKEKAEQGENKIKEQKLEIELQNERLESLLRISQFQTNSIQELLDFALEEAIKLTTSKIGYIYFYNETSRQFILNTWSKEVMTECSVIDTQTVYDLDSTGCWGEAVRQRKPIVINEYQAENPFKKGTPEGHVKLYKFLTIPVIIDNKIVAVAGVANKKTDYDNSDIRQLTLLMDNVWKISERISFIDKLNKAKEKAELSEKELGELNATKDKLFSIIAHDLKSPFNSILGFTDLLIEHIHNRNFKKSESLISFISSSAKNTFNLLNNLLDWAKSQTGQLSFTPRLLLLSEIIHPIIDVQIFAAEIKNISINYFQSEEIYVFADQNILETILRNLVSNAIKYTNTGGRVEIQAIKKETHTELSVSDNGTGMSKDVIDKLFLIGEQESLQGTSGEKGTGLGLILCKDFVEKHGGKIWIHSEPEKGSIFYFSIPNKPV
ncbi:MAG: hypothetical protein A2X13_03050 [Bacteroidetes bacterium GWC2_33_15]|nr:MAG: hypothetical protein A2X10_09585 [Bacteroidetes bacterium GWA2_33_15]OFX49524.1 MAG: hypothetical protein A2X13_03050 [Bacteroidetes bacterium GWC2_33_15]OFX63637.1 MAG: hypothetical protein A2X15_01175 [Bacteroidetes bacterium GWB2_32_14]OFX68851.1 MAG: hypothetical protein A2X14_13170 [Bacteroidetes bacterium GWD2_33_33]HAN17552.1 hypothetical protein [Bacteroidales bacterium]